MIGKTILHYKIIEKLGEGGMGIVYKAHDTKLKRDVAIKFLPRQIAANQEERERFKIEAQAAAALNHPNIATIHYIEEIDDELFIVMEYIEGQELKDIIDQIPPVPPLEKGGTASPPPSVKGERGGFLPVETVINYATQIAKGLDAAHKKGIVHRDIKSANIMITGDDHVKIMDFGLAKVRGGTLVTKAGTTLGTAAYMSPEQAQGDEVDHRSDIWSFGVVLYEMLTGPLPFKGDYEQAVIYAILNEEPGPLSEVQPDLPDEFQQILNKALAKDLDQRYQNAHELIEDLNPDSKQKTTGYTKKSAAPAERSFPKKWAVLAGILVLVLILVTIILFLFNKNQPDSISTEKSIAVLPFANLSTDPEQEYFADGMAEEIINALAQIPGLKVSARTSSFQFRGQEADIKTIGEKLGVANVLEGSVRKSGNRLRVTAQLINISDGFHIWSNTYERELTDVFAIQDDLSQSIVEALQVKLSGDQFALLSSRNVNNIEAYNLYLKGRYYWNKRTEEDINKSIEYFQQAIQLDSTYAQAYAGLGDAYMMVGVYGRKPPRESFPLAKSYIEKALQIDSKLAEAYASLGDINIHFDWDLDAAESNLRKAIELNPQYASGYHWYSEVLVLRGEFESAYLESQRALEVDPYALIISSQLGEHYGSGGNFQNAIKELQKVIEFDSTFVYAYYDLGIVYVELQKYDEAVTNLRKAHYLSPNDTRVLAALGYAEAFSGNEEEARRIENELLERAKHQFVSAHDLAVISLALRKKDLALEYLEQAYNERCPWMPFLSLNPVLNSLRNDPQFRALTEKVGFAL